MKIQLFNEDRLDISIVDENVNEYVSEVLFFV